MQCRLSAHSGHGGATPLRPEYPKKRPWVASRIANDLSGIFAALDLRDHAGPVDQAAVEAAARGVMQVSGTDHGLAVLIAHGSDAGGGESDGTIFLAVASNDTAVSRSAQIIGDEHRVRLGAVEMGLDCLRRHLRGLAFDERVDFEKSK